MDEVRKRRIVKRAGLCTAVATLLFSMYVQVYFAIWYGMGRGIVSGRTYRMLQETVYAPVECYIDDRYPSRDTMNRLRSWAYFKGAGMPVAWQQIDGPADHPLWYKPQPTPGDVAN
jgi:hypothetical protein